MNRSPAFQFYPKDFLSSLRVQMMTVEEIGAYCLLLFNSWLQKDQGYLPDDEALLRRVCRMTEEQWREHGEAVLSCFERVDGQVFNPRLMLEKQRQDEYQEQCRRAANTRWEKHRKAADMPTQCDGNADAMQTVCISSSSSSSSADEEKARARDRARALGSESASGRSEQMKVPSELQGLELYEQDARLCARWPKLLPAWRKAYPGVDIVAAVKRAHAWEVSNPKRHKVNRARFLSNWLSREQDRTQRPQQPAPRQDWNSIDYTGEQLRGRNG